MRRILFFLFLSAALSLCCQPSCAEEGTDSLNLRIYFRTGSARIEPGYLNNAGLLGKFISEVKAIMSDPAYEIQSITIRSSASPDGNFNHNQELSRKRGMNLSAYLRNALSLPSDKITIEAVGEDWAALRTLVEMNEVPDKQNILLILDKYSRYVDGNSSSDTEVVKRELRRLDGGRTWKWLLNNIFPDLRSAGNNTVCRYTRVEPAVEPVKKQENTAVIPEHRNDTIVVIHKYIFEVDTVKMMSGELPFKMEIKVPGNVNVADSARARFRNSLIDASFTPNIEIKVPEGGKNVGVAIDNKVVIPQKQK